METKDAEILKLYADGRTDEAFNAIVASCGERLYWHLRRFVCSHEDADDLLQETLVKVWNSIGNFKGGSSLYTWIWRIATNEALSFLRRNRLRAAMKAESLETLMDRLIDEDGWFDGNELQREVQKAVNSLPARQKQVFVLRYFDEMPYEQMSEVLNISVGSLKASYHHAYTKVKDYLEKRF